MTRSPWRTAALTLLLFLGLSHMLGTLFTPIAPKLGESLSGVGRLTLASPHPKVFCQVGEHEPYGFAFSMEVRDAAGHHTTVPLDAARYSRLPGPYMYRNVYGAALAFSPFLDDATTQSILHYGLCESGDLKAVLDEPDTPIVSAVIHTEPRRPGPPVASVEVVCK